MSPNRQGKSAFLPGGVWPALLALAGAVIYAWNYREIFNAWFYREDSRYFANGLPSLYDLIFAFTSPHNSMGHYRPITKLLWSVPQWMGFGEAAVYHGLMLALFGISCALLARLSYLLFGHATLAVLAGALFSLMPVNAKPVYWISACQNITASLFVFAAFVFRIEQWRQPGREKLFRSLCLLSLLLALTSREAAFAASPLLLLIDLHFGKGKRAWDTALVWAGMVLFVFVLNSPFTRAKVQATPEAFFSLGTLSDFWNYSMGALWALGDNISPPYAFYCAPVTVILLLLGLAGPFLHRSLLFASLLGLAGIAPFLVIRAFSMEYAFFLGAAFALLATGALALLLKRFPFRRADLFVAAAGLVALLGYCHYLTLGRHMLRNLYSERSQLMRSFLGELAEFSRTLPPYRAIEIVDFGPYKGSEARDSHHFIGLALPELVPDRVILFSRKALGTEEGTGHLSDPSHRDWRQKFAGIERPIRIRYTEKGFTRD